MRWSRARHINIFRVIRDGAVNPTPKQLELKEDLERSYFKDMRDLTADPTGKYFAAERPAVPTAFPFLAAPGLVVRHTATAHTWSKEELKGHVVVIASQLALYASPQAVDWRERIVARLPQLASRVYCLEVREKNFAYAASPAAPLAMLISSFRAYSLLRRVTDGMVTRAWCANLQPGETEASRRASMLAWQETAQNHSLARQLRKDSGLHLNKYIPFVYVLGAKGMVLFRACGSPLDAEVDLLVQVVEGKPKAAVESKQ